MSLIKSLLDQFKNKTYSVNNAKSDELLFTYDVDPEGKLKKLSKISTFMTVDEGLKYFKIGLYLSAFEDENAFVFFREAKKRFSNINDGRAEFFLNYINSDSVNEEILLMGINHKKSDEYFEKFRKSKDYDEILKYFDLIRQEILGRNYTTYKSIARIIKHIQDQSIEEFKDHLKKFKIGHKVIERKRRNEFVELKSRLKAEQIMTVSEKLRACMKKEYLDFFVDRKMITAETILSIKNNLKEKQSDLLALVEQSRKNTGKISAPMKEKVIGTITKNHQQLQELEKIEQKFKSLQRLESISYDRKYIAAEKEINKKYEEKHKELRDEHRGGLNFRRIFYETIRKLQYASMFGKDVVRIFSTKRETYSEITLWQAFEKMYIGEQDYTDWSSIKNYFEGMKKKIFDINRKANAVFEKPDQIYREIDDVVNNVR